MDTCPRRFDRHRHISSEKPKSQSLSSTSATLHRQLSERFTTIETSADRETRRSDREVFVTILLKSAKFERLIRQKTNKFERLAAPNRCRSAPRPFPRSPLQTASHCRRVSRVVSDLCTPPLFPEHFSKSHSALSPEIQRLFGWKPFDADTGQTLKTACQAAIGLSIFE